CDGISRLSEKSGEFVNSRAPAPGLRRRPRKIRINAQENRDMQAKTKKRRRRQTFTAPANDPRTCLGRLPAPRSPLKGLGRWRHGLRQGSPTRELCRHVMALVVQLLVVQLLGIEPLVGRRPLVPPYTAAAARWRRT